MYIIDVISTSLESFHYFDMIRWWTIQPRWGTIDACPNASASSDAMGVMEDGVIGVRVPQQKGRTDGEAKGEGGC